MNSFFETLLTYKNLNAVVFEEKEYSYQDLIDRIIEVKKILSQNNILQGSRVVILSDYSFLAISVFFSLCQLKAVIIPISTKNESEIESKLAVSEADFIIKFKDNNLHITELLNTMDKHELYIRLQKSNRAGLVLFSSGTTGLPKAMVLDLNSYFDRLVPSLKQYITIVFLMFDHIGGLNTLLQILVSGGTLVIPNNRDSSHILDMIEKYSVQLLPTSPTFLNLILISEAYKDFNLNSLKYITYGTEPMPQILLNRLNEIFPNTKFKQTYGLSELGIMKTQSKNPGSLFMKLGGEGFDYKISENQLFIKSETSMLGYLNAENPFDKDGYFATGDTVEVDEDGFVKIIGRIKDFINVGGQKVTPAEVEGVIMSIAGILDVTVRGEKNAIVGEIVVAYVLAKEDVDNVTLKEKILTKCYSELEKYKVPIKIMFVEKINFSERFKKTRLGQF